MKIEVLLAIRSKSGKDIPAILSSIHLDSDAQIAVYHHGCFKEERFDYKGYSIYVHYTPRGIKTAAYNTLLHFTEADVVLLASPTDKLASGYADTIELAFGANPKCDGILFGTSKDSKRVGTKEARNQPLASLCMKTSVLRERGVLFSDVDDEAFCQGVIDVFCCDFVAWPSRCAGSRTSILTSCMVQSANERNRVFYDAHTMGVAWPLASIVRYFQKGSQKHPSLKQHLREARIGRRVYLFHGYEEESRPIKQNPLPFMVSLISLFGLAIQLVLSLLIVFTEVQYIPIWFALLFVVGFTVIYAFASSKTHNAKAVLRMGLLVAASSFIAALITYLFMKVSWAMAVYGSFICLAAIFGVVYCFTPPRIRKK